MEILKRNGQIEKYDGSKIMLAIEKAMIDVGVQNKQLSEDIEEDISQEIYATEEVWTVEEVSDRVEELLMKNGAFSVAKAFILYRNKRREERKFEDESPNKYKFLSKEFLNKYKHLKPPMTELGNLVYYRTYSRYLPEKKRREYWWETCARTVDYNIGLAKWNSKEDGIKEAELFFDNMFSLKQFPSGRAMWSSGTQTSYSRPISQFNCAFAVYDNFDILKDIAYLLMLGVGFGFSVEKQYVDLLPKIRGNVNVIHQYYEPVKKHARKQITEINVSADVMEIIVGDDKMGWASAIDYFAKVFYHTEFMPINHLIINYNSVRPFGEPLKTFGGTASGHEALLKILDKLEKVFKRDNSGWKKFKPIDAMDTATIIAEGIVVGGVRRSAEMCLSGDDDKEMAEAKMSLYTQDSQGNWIVNEDIIHRMMSNNSTAYWEKPSFETLKQRFEIIKHSAENNFFNMEAARKRKPNVKGTNPLTA